MIPAVPWLRLPKWVWWVILGAVVLLALVVAGVIDVRALAGLVLLPLTWGLGRGQQRPFPGIAPQRTELDAPDPPDVTERVAVVAREQASGRAERDRTEVASAVAPGGPSPAEVARARRGTR